MRLVKYSLLLLLLYSCSQNSGIKNNPSSSQNLIENLTWLTGTWKSSSQNTVMYEAWAKTNNSLMAGNSFALLGKDTVFSEKIALQQIGDELYYTPTVSDQNEGNPVPFKFIGCVAGEYIFENKERDFPQRIIYKNPQPDFLCARIEGTKNGKFTKEDFNFVKVK